jgi:cyclophilin family peptidyl-prolyl cis-trans isomerase
MRFPSRKARVCRAGIAIACLVTAGSVVRAQREAIPLPLKYRMLAAEDARPAMEPDREPSRGSRASGAGNRVADPLSPLFDGLTSLPEVQTAAVRGLGRLERPDLVRRIAMLLVATTPSVRAEAANALAQAVYGSEAALVFDRLRARVAAETDPMVRGALARSLGRLSYRTAAEVEAAQAAVLALLDPPPAQTARPTATTPAPSAASRGPALVTVLGVANGLESLARRMTRVAPLGDAARTRLVPLTRVGLDAGGTETLPAADRADGRRVRRLALSALTAAGAVDQSLVTTTMSDPDAQVRRLAIVAAGRVTLEPWVLDVLERALFDTDPRVRIEALRQRGEAGGRVACQAAKLEMADENEHVALAAIDLAGHVCVADVAAAQSLDELATPPEAHPVSHRVAWQRPAHALISLARLLPDRTRARLARFARHDVWQIRMYAARAAGIAGATAVLDTLARDANANVCDAALTELARRLDRRADPLLVAALARPDGQLVRNAARALAGTRRQAEVARALIAALARITVESRETSRDVRMAILDRLEEVGLAWPATRDELAAYVADFDPAVAARAAALQTKWRGAAGTAEPQLARRPLARLPLPTLERLAYLRGATVTITMARGGLWRLRLFPDEAPTNVARFARLAAAGFFNGLTFHRVEPTFVIQGGSPGANEYAGDGPFTRDEVGLRSHLRGTVGISTRGRDTGDGQIFVNLIDNLRLDHNYTIIGEVIDGMEVVDGILEGDVIERIVLEGARRRP